MNSALVRITDFLSRSSSAGREGVVVAVVSPLDWSAPLADGAAAVAAAMVSYSDVVCMIRAAVCKRQNTGAAVVFSVCCWKVNESSGEESSSLIEKGCLGTLRPEISQPQRNGSRCNGGKETIFIDRTFHRSALLIYLQRA